MVSLVQIPREIISMILENLDDLADLPSAVLTCRTLYGAFHDRVICSILRDQLTPGLVNIAIAVELALEDEPVEELRSTLAATGAATPTDWATRLTKLPWKSLLGIQQTHRKIEVSAMDFSSKAWAFLQGSDGAPQVLGMEDFVLSSAEKHRFCQTLYRVELHSRHFSKDLGLDPAWRVVHDWQLQLRPWEAEQMGCFWEYYFDRLARGKPNNSQAELPY
ncbi:hypothetical protein OQA88_7890 [Cercophora sp. LCS_1]